jgi:protein-disulfide isomerase-like protein with CxxC motif
MENMNLLKMKHQKPFPGRAGKNKHTQHTQNTHKILKHWVKIGFPQLLIEQRANFSIAMNV